MEQILAKMEEKFDILVDYIIGKFEEDLRNTPQSKIFHGEGDVYTHTMMVCDALTSLDEYKVLPSKQQYILYVAALLHDVGKISTTVLQDGDLHSPNHGSRGSKMARELLFKDLGISGKQEYMEFRETVCMLVRNHMFPPHAIYQENSISRLHKMSSNGIVLPDYSNKMLYLLSKADILGRKSDDTNKLLDDVEYFAELAKEEQCFDTYYKFKSDYARRQYLLGKTSFKDMEFYNETWGNVIMMSGLPGVGKDYMINLNLKNLPMISLDEIRKEHKIKPTDNQGKLVNIGREKAKEYLRNCQPFVWNATNITPQMRESLISLFEGYRASVTINYIEASWNRILKQNSDRENIVPQKAISGMLGKLLPPSVSEATTVNWIGIEG